MLHLLVPCFFYPCSFLSSYCSFPPSFALYFFQTPSLCPCFWNVPFLHRGESLWFSSLFRSSCRSCVGDTVHVRWLQRELVHAANWHLLFGSCLFKCCKGFLHMANQALHVHSWFLFKKGLSWSKPLSFSCQVTDCVQHTCNNLLCDGSLWGAQSRAGLVPAAEREACCHTFVWVVPESLGRKPGMG